MIKPLDIGGVRLDNNLLMAPIAGFTEAGFRYVCRMSGAGLAVTEMVSAKALHYRNQNTQTLLSLTEAETPSCAQIFGSEPDIMAEVCASEYLAEFDIIDINMGCPVPKVAGNGEGSALMKTPALARQIVAGCVKAAGLRPVTVKIRSGWDESSRNCAEFAAMCEEAGAAAVTVHARTRQQMFSGSADIEDFAKVKKAVKIPVIANGDIRSADDIKRIYEYSGADGFMIGRAALGNPGIFALLTGGKPQGTLEYIETHITVLKRFFSDNYIARSMRGHLAHYLKGLKGSRELKNRIFASEDLDYVMREIRAAYGGG